MCQLFFLIESNSQIILFIYPKITNGKFALKGFTILYHYTLDLDKEKLSKKY